MESASSSSLGRSGEVRDVIIDTAGASAGIIVYLVVIERRKRKTVK